MIEKIFNPEISFVFPESLGDFVSTGNASNDRFSSIQDGDPVVRTYNNFTINTGHTVTTTNRCKGLYLNILGDLTVNGTLSMTARGASAIGKYVLIDKNYKKIYYSVDLNTKFNYADFILINKIGGAASTIQATNGNNGINGSCGGGGCGYVEFNSTLMGLGGAGTSFSGGAGGGAKIGRPANISGNGSSNGGPGGNGITDSGTYPAGGGAGNPGGTTNIGNPGETGTGGLLILFVQGNIIIGSNGSIQSNGSNGGISYGSGGRIRRWCYTYNI